MEAIQSLSQRPYISQFDLQICQALDRPLFDLQEPLLDLPKNPAILIIKKALEFHTLRVSFKSSVQR